MEWEGEGEGEGDEGSARPLPFSSHGQEPTPAVRSPHNTFTVLCLRAPLDIKTEVVGSCQCGSTDLFRAAAMMRCRVAVP